MAGKLVVGLTFYPDAARQGGANSWGKPYVYYEAWKVVNGLVKVLNNGLWVNPGYGQEFHDKFGLGGGLSCSLGPIRWQGELSFVKSIPFEHSHVKCAGKLPSTEQYSMQKGSEPGTLSLDWGCCKLKPGCKPPKRESCPKTCKPGPCYDCTAIYNPH